MDSRKWMVHVYQMENDPKMTPIKQIADNNFPTREEIKEAMRLKLGRSADLPGVMDIIEPCAEAAERLLLKTWRRDKSMKEI